MPPTAAPRGAVSAGRLPSAVSVTSQRCPQEGPRRGTRAGGRVTRPWHPGALCPCCAGEGWADPAPQRPVRPPAHSPGPTPPLPGGARGLLAPGAVPSLPHQLGGSAPAAPGRGAGRVGVAFGWALSTSLLTFCDLHVFYQVFFLGGKPSTKNFLTRERTGPEETAVCAAGVGAGSAPGTPQSAPPVPLLYLLF